MLKLLSRPAQAVLDRARLDKAAGNALVFADGLKRGGPWVFSVRAAKGLPPVSTFDDSDEHGARSWLKRMSRRGAPILLLPDTRYSTDRPVMAGDLVGSSLIGVKLAVTALLDDAPEPPTALVNDNGIFTAIWKLAKQVDMEAANGIARLLADIVSGEPTHVVPLSAILVHHRKPFIYSPEQLGWERGKPSTSVLSRIKDRRKAAVAVGSGAFHSAFSITAAPTQWLWPNVFPLGAMSLLSGQAGMGKSQIAVSVAAVVSAGLSWASGEPFGAPSGVILMECEDSAADTQARLLAAGADLSRISMRGREDGPLDLTGPDMAALAEEAKRMTAAGNPVRLVVLSPGLSFFGVKGGNDDAAVREKLRMILLWAAQNNATVLFLTHPPKNAKPTLDAQFAGADTYKRAARTAWAVLPDAGDDEPDMKRKRRVMICAKSNVGPDDVRVLYRIEGVTLADSCSQELRGSATSRIKWLLPAATAVHTAVHTVHRENVPVESWLASYLADGQAHDGKELKEAARLDGIHHPKLYAAARSLGVVIKPGRFLGARLWSMPDAPDPVD